MELVVVDNLSPIFWSNGGTGGIGGGGDHPSAGAMGTWWWMVEVEVVRPKIRELLERRFWWISGIVLIAYLLDKNCPP